MGETRTTVEIVRTVRRERITLPGSFVAPCDGCGSEGLFVSVAAANLNFRIASRLIFRLVESGAVHCFEDAEGLLFVCIRSVAALDPRCLPSPNGETK